MRTAHTIIPEITISLLSLVIGLPAMAARQDPADTTSTWLKDSRIIATRAEMRKLEAEQLKELNDVRNSVLSDMQILELKDRQDEMKLTNSRLTLQQLTNEQKLLESRADSTRLNITNQQQQIKRQQAIKAQQHDMMLKHKAALRRMERASAQEREQFWILSCIAILIALAYAFYMIWNRHHMKAVKKEKARATENRLKAEQATRLKAFFLQNMSHDLRSPLNAIQGFSELIYDPNCPISAEDRKQFLDLIHTNTDLLITLIDDIVDQSKLESGNYVKKLSDMPVLNICQTTVISNERRLMPGVTMQVEEPKSEEEKALVMFTDRSRVQQVLTNFITNACKYTEQGSIVLAYELTQGGSHVRFSVTDTGRGIPTEEAEKIFDRFSMLKNSKKGTGLGLSICRIIADLLEGRCWLDTAYTSGARFCFEIPVISH